MNRPKIRSLSRKEQEKRWRQHQAAKRSERNIGTRNTKIRATGELAQIHLSSCAQEYFLAQMAPFSLKSNACVPDLHSIPSKKVRVKTRFTFSTGADGNGFAVCCNWCNASGGSAFLASTSALAASSGVLPLGTPNVGFVTQPKLPYASADFQATGSTPGVQARTVAVGMRIRYIGPEIARSGQIVGIRHPDNETLVNLSYTNILSYSTSKTYKNDRRWTYVMWRPVRPEEYHFSADPETASDGVNYKWETGFTITGTTNSSGTPGPAPFEAEVIRYVEYIGNIDNVTKSHVDIVGMSHIRNSLPVKSTTQKPGKMLQHAVKHIEDSIGESLPAAAAGALGYKHLFSSEAASAEAAEGSSILDVLGSFATDAVAALPEAMETLGPLALLM